MSAEFVLLNMVNWHPDKDAPAGIERLLLRNDENLTESLRVHIRMMCELYLPTDLVEVPQHTLDTINQYTFSTKMKVFEFYTNTNHIEVTCEYKRTDEIL